MGIGIDSEQVEIVYPGLNPKPEASAGEPCSTEQGCITCGDVALPLRVLRVDADRGLALCEDEQGRHETVETALVLPVEPDDQLLVHAGTAIAHEGRAAEVGPPPAAPPRTPGREAEDVRQVSRAEDVRQVSEGAGSS